MAKIVGTVKQAAGPVGVKKENGELHTLKIGDSIEENDVVHTLRYDSSLVLDLEGDRELSVGPDQEVLIDQSVFAAVGEGEAVDVAALQAALLEGLDPSDLEETAAGEELLGDSVAEGVRAERGDARGDVNADLRGTENTPFEVELTPEEDLNLPPEAEDDFAVAIEEGKGPQHRYGRDGDHHEGEGHDGEDGEHGGHGNRYQYDAPVQAFGNVLANDSDDNKPNPPSDLDVVKIGSDGTGNAMSADGEGNFVVVGLYGTLVINGETGEFVYTVNDKNPNVDSMNVGDAVQDSFTYTVSDSMLTDTATLTITINGTNDAPIATADEGFAKERGYHEQGEFATGNVITDSQTGDHDVDNEEIFIIDVKRGEPQGGGGHEGGDGGEGGGHNGGDELLFMAQEISGPESDFVINGTYGKLYMWENGEYLYVPKNGNPVVDSLNEGDWVRETFTYTVSDGDKYAKTTLTINLEGTNDAPVAHTDETTISEDYAWPPVTINVLVNDTDVDSGDTPANFSIDSVSIVSGDGLVWVHDNLVKYLPNWFANQSLNEGDIKEVVIEYTMSDDSGAPSTSTVTVTIEGVNDHPFAICDFARGDENHLFVLPVLANDWDVDSGDNASNFSLDQISYHGPGTASIVGNQLQFDPGTAFDYLDDGERATVKIWYRMSDDSGARSNWTTATITLLGSNDAPVAVDDFDTVDFDEFTVAFGGGNGWDIDNITVIGSEGSKLWINNGNEKLGVSNTEWGDSKLIDNWGTDEAVRFDFDGMLQHVEVNLSSFNSIPIFQDRATWAVYVEGQADAVASGTFMSPANEATLVIDTGHLVFDTLIVGTPLGSFDNFFIDSITGYGIDINSDLTLMEGGPLLIPESYLIANDYDVEGDPLNVVDIDTTGTVGEVTIDAEGNVTYDPAGRFDHLETGEVATDTFTYLLSDGDLTDTATVTVNVIGGSTAADSIHNLDLVDILLGYDAEEGYDTVTLSSIANDIDIDFDLLGERVDNIEHIDLQGGSKTLNNITPEGVSEITDTDNFLRISGEADDSIQLDGFTEDSATSANLDGYSAYVGTYGGEQVTLHIDTNIDVDLIP